MKLSKPETLGFSSARLARINAVTQRYVDDGKFAGIVTLIARRGKVVHFESVGQQEIESNTPMKKDSIFRIYSMTKPITTTAAMMLLEEGAFRLGDPLAKYIPAFEKTKVCVGTSFQGPILKSQTTPMTIRQLMTHTAGLSYGWKQDTPVDAIYRSLAPRTERPDLTLAKFVDVLAEAPLVFQPGSA